MWWRRRAAVLVLGTLLAFGTGYWAAHDYIRGAAFVVRAAGMQGIARTVAEWEAGEVAEQPLTIPWRGGALPARKYLPIRANTRLSWTFLLTRCMSRSWLIVSKNLATSMSTAIR